MAEDLEDTQDLDAYAAPRERVYQFIRFENEQGVARIVLNRPPANLLSLDMMADINHALESLEYQRDVKLVVFSADPAKSSHFSGGFPSNDNLGDRAYLVLEGFRRIFENLAKLDKPTLAVVGKPALGAGSMLALGCDLVLVSASVKFYFAEIKAGLFNTVAVAVLPELLGRKRAFDLLLAGGNLTAADAERLGVVSRVAPDEKLEEESAAIVKRFQEGSAVVFQMTRRAIAGGLDRPFAEAVRHAEDVYLNQLMGTEDAAEGLKAIIEKRKPVWKGQ